MKKTKLNPKSKLAQKVLIYTINEFLSREMFGLEIDDNRWGGASKIEFELDGVPAIASVGDAGHGELSIKVALWPTDHGKKLVQATLIGATGDAMGGFYASAWLAQENRARLLTSVGNIWFIARGSGSAMLSA